LALVILLGFCASCKDKAQKRPQGFIVESVGLELPRVSGWLQDSKVKATNPADGGTALRLIREGAIPGSPRIEVYVGPRQALPTRLEEFVHESLQWARNMEGSGRIRVLEVSQKRVHVGPRRATRVRHEYVMLADANKIPITQVTTMMILDGRGISITAVGQTELFHPLADSINRIISGVTTPAERAGNRIRLVPKSGPKGSKKPSKGSKPVDLGKIGE